MSAIRGSNEVEGGGRRWMEVEGGGRRWMEVDGGGWRWMEVDAGGWRWKEVQERDRLDYDGIDFVGARYNPIRRISMRGR
jgi:hypothetical protein